MNSQQTALTVNVESKLKASLQAQMPTYAIVIEAIKDTVDSKVFWSTVMTFGRNAIKKGRLAANATPEDILNEVLSTAAGDLLWALNKNVVDPFDRMSIAKAIASIPHDIPADIGSDAPLASELKQSGFLKLNDLLDPTQVKELATYLGTRKLYAQDGPTYSNIVEDVVSAPHALALAANPRVLNIVKDFLGGLPTIVDVCAWWTIPTATEDYGAHIFHRDKDDFRACKMFFYLTDVETEDGPHIFARFTHDPHFTKIFLAQHGLSEDLMRPLFEGNGRHIADSIPKIFGEHIFEITGKAGTAFLESTYGFHRGKTAKRNQRGLFQVMYALVPYPLRLERFASIELDRLPPDCVDSQLTRYAARLMLKQP